jgi:hypothetical protein
MIVNPILNHALNKIHYWSEPDKNPMKRMFLTRFAEIGCAGIEASLIAIRTMQLGALIIKNLFHPLLNPSSPFPYKFAVIELAGKAHEVAALIEGLTSTIFFGVIFSPEANFKVHLNLKLAVDNEAEKMQKERTAKLQAELQKAEITKMRNARYAKLEAEQQAVKDAEAQAYVVNSRLAELFLTK